MYVLPFSHQGQSGHPGPTGPPGPRGYQGPKVSYSHSDGLFITLQTQTRTGVIGLFY